MILTFFFSVLVAKPKLFLPLFYFPSILGWQVAQSRNMNETQNLGRASLQHYHSYYIQKDHISSFEESSNTQLRLHCAMVYCLLRDFSHLMSISHLLMLKKKRGISPDRGSRGQNFLPNEGENNIFKLDSHTQQPPNMMLISCLRLLKAQEQDVFLNGGGVRLTF